MAKKISNESILGEQGLVLIKEITLGMGYVIRQETVFDAGIDAHIEIRDRTTQNATNRRLLLQGKATDKSFSKETDESFHYTVKKDDLEYWLGANLPVIIVVCRPRTREAYWVSIRDYFDTPEKRAGRKIAFDKQCDKFDASVAEKLARLVQTPIPIIQSPLNEVVGRDNLVDEIIGDLNAGKVVQLWGMPGVGKSTLAAYIGSKLEKPKGSFLLDVRTLFSSESEQSSREGKLSLEILIRTCVEAFGGGIGSNPLTEAQNLFKDSERLLILG